LRVNYGYEWVESFYEAGHRVRITVTELRLNNQDVGASYYGADGHWVANAFVRNPRIVASIPGDWFWIREFNPGMVPLTHPPAVEFIYPWQGGSNRGSSFAIT
jgi:hypothetical protein